MSLIQDPDIPDQGRSSLSVVGPKPVPRTQMQTDKFHRMTIEPEDGHREGSRWSDIAIP